MNYSVLGTIIYESGLARELGLTLLTFEGFLHCQAAFNATQMFSHRSLHLLCRAQAQGRAGATSFQKRDILAVTIKVITIGKPVRGAAQDLAGAARPSPSSAQHL